MQINNGAASGNGEFFKPAEHKMAELIIFEPTSTSPSQYKNEDGSPKLNAVGTYTIFLSAAELEAGKPSTIMKDSACGSGTLAKSLIESMGQITVGKLEQVPPKAAGRQPYWVISPVSQEQTQQAVAYLEAREEAKKAALPGFFE